MSKQCEFSNKCDGFNSLSHVCMDEEHRIRMPDEDMYCGFYRLFREEEIELKKKEEQ